jgi:hypothetical protein
LREREGRLRRLGRSLIFAEDHGYSFSPVLSQPLLLVDQLTFPVNATRCYWLFEEVRD